MGNFLKLCVVVLLAGVSYSVYSENGQIYQELKSKHGLKTPMAYPSGPVQQPGTSFPNKLSSQDRSDLIQGIADNTQDGVLTRIREDAASGGFKVNFEKFYEAMLKARSVNERNAAELYIPHLDARELYRLSEIGEAEAVGYIIAFEEREIDGLLKPWVESVATYQSLVFDYYNEIAADDEQIALLNE